MPIELSDFLNLRPFTFHITGATNLEAIRHDKALISASKLLTGTPHAALLEDFRRQSHLLQLAGHLRLIRDQRPIRPNSVELELGTTMTQYRNAINRRVFFWPGRHNRLIRSGRKHFAHYASMEPLYVLCVPLASLLEANPNASLFVSRCNSGSARHQGGQRVTRGPRVFRTLDEADFLAREVVELSFLNRAALPSDAQFAPTPEGPWQALWPVTRRSY